MKPTTITLVALALAWTAPARAQDPRDLVITRAAARPSRVAPAENFTGTVRVQPLFDTTAAARAYGASVAFEAGARTAWHTHPRGQVLIVTEGVGRVQRWGAPVEEIRPGDVVRIPPGAKHWHGASPTTAMTHIAIAEHRGGSTAEWLEQVSDAQYRRPVTPPARGSSGVPHDTAPGRGPYADIAPALDQLTQQVLFGQVWERPGLSKRDRSLITVATLVAGYRTNELPYHLRLALQNGVTKDELTELITHLAFYAGWPTANSAIEIARKAFAESAK